IRDSGTWGNSEDSRRSVAREPDERIEMSRIQDILSKAERDGTARRTRALADEGPPPIPIQARHGSPAATAFEPTHHAPAWTSAGAPWVGGDAACARHAAHAVRSHPARHASGRAAGRSAYRRAHG